MKTRIGYCSPTAAAATATATATGRHDLRIFEMNHAFNHTVWIDWSCHSSAVRRSPSDKRSTSSCPPNCRSSQWPRRRTDRAVLARRSDSVGFRWIFTPGAIFNHQADSLLNSDPVVLLRNNRSRFVNSGMLMRVHPSRNLILTLRIGNNLLILEHQPFRILTICSLVLVFCGKQFIMSCSRSQAGLFRSVGSVRILAVFEVKAYLFEAFVRNEVGALGA